MKKIKTIRFDDRTWMLLQELSDKTRASISAIVRCMVKRNIDDLLDESGNWKTDEETVQKE